MNLVHPYLDGELVGEEHALIERHVASCQPCGALFSFHARFKEDLRAKLRSRSARPEPPERLRQAVSAALDHADVARGWKRAMPFAGALAAAAALLVFIGARSSNADSPIVEEAIRGHEKNLPVELGGPSVSDDDIRSWMLGKVPVPVRPPLRRGVMVRAAMSSPVNLLGARVYHLRNRDAGQLFYRVGPSPITVYVFDASGWDFSAPVVRTVGTHEVFLTEERGYSVALYRDRGVGYAFTSDLPQSELLSLVAASLSE